MMPVHFRQNCQLTQVIDRWPCVCVCREGHTSLVKELEQDLREKPGAVVLSVGGGGLLNGVVEGLRRADWADVPIVAMETMGAHSLNAAMKAGELVTLPAITRYCVWHHTKILTLCAICVYVTSLTFPLPPPSVATTLGLTRVSAQTMKLVEEHTVFSEVVTDQEAVKAVEHFVGEYDPHLDRCYHTRSQMGKDELWNWSLVSSTPADDEKVLVEPACGAALAAVYSGIIKRLQGEGKLAQPLGPVVIVVCGGNNISMEQLWRLKKQLGVV